MRAELRGLYYMLALSLVSGDWDRVGSLIPQEIWDRLYEEALIVSQGDQTGESWPRITCKGTDLLIERITDVRA